MPKAGETPEMGSNPQLGFGRVYARPQVAKWLDRRVIRLLNDDQYGWNQFYREIKEAGITVGVLPSIRWRIPPGLPKVRKPDR
jgi:hypothetical protein